MDVLVPVPTSWRQGRGCSIRAMRHGRRSAGWGGLNNHARVPFFRDQVAVDAGGGSGRVDLDPEVGQ